MSNVLSIYFNVFFYTDLKEPQSDVLYITVIPTVEKDAIESDCDSDWSDREYQGEKGHLLTRLLNGEAEITYQEDENKFNLRTPDLAPDTRCPPQLPCSLISHSCGIWC